MANGNYYVYIQLLKGNDGREVFYTGYTSKSVTERTKQHKAHIKNKRRKTYTGRSKSTKWVYYETYESKEDALNREKEIKKKNRQYKEGLIRGFKEAYTKYKLKKK